MDLEARLSELEAWLHTMDFSGAAAVSQDKFVAGAQLASPRLC